MSSTATEAYPTGVATERTETNPTGTATELQSTQRHMPHAPHASTNAVERDYSTVVFVNIDWKASRHNTELAVKRNMDLLKTTVRSIVKTHKPVVICFCEVGETGNPLTLRQMSAVSQVIKDTWHTLLQSTTELHSSPYKLAKSSRQIMNFQET